MTPRISSGTSAALLEAVVLSQRDSLTAGGRLHLFVLLCLLGTTLFKLCTSMHFFGSSAYCIWVLGLRLCVTHLRTSRVKDYREACC